MARNGVGGFILPVTPFVDGQIITASDMNTSLDDIATALTGSVAVNGEAPMTGNLAMGTKKLTGLGVGSATTDSISLIQAQGGAFTWLTSVSGTDTITASVTPSITTYPTGTIYRFPIGVTNTGPVTLNVSSVGAKAITKDGVHPLVARDLLAGEVVAVIYDGTRFQLMNPSSMTITRVQAITTTNIAALTTTQLAALTIMQIASLTTTQSAALTTAQLTGLT